MSAPTATTAQPAAAPAQAELELTGVAGFLADQQRIIDEWNARGEKYERFVATYDEATVAAFDRFTADLGLALAALAKPGRAGRSAYSPRDLLVDLRHLRSLNDNLTREGVTDEMIARVCEPRGKIRWGVAEAQGSALTYSQLADRTAKALAIALKN